MPFLRGFAQVTAGRPCEANGRIGAGNLQTVDAGMCRLLLASDILINPQWSKSMPAEITRIYGAQTARSQTMPGNKTRVTLILLDLGQNAAS
jgi:hypothetical protein